MTFGIFPALTGISFKWLFILSIIQLLAKFGRGHTSVDTKQTIIELELLSFIKVSLINFFVVGTSL